MNLNRQANADQRTSFKCIKTDIISLYRFLLLMQEEKTVQQSLAFKLK